MFFEALNKSPWKGVIAEVGIGLEFSSRLLRVPGASNTVIQVICDYAGLDRNKDFRAVSLENARDMAHRALQTAMRTLSEHDDQSMRFGLAITGAHYQDKPSHVYVYLATPKWDAYMHFSTPTYGERDHVGSIVSHKIQWFMNACMLSTEPWQKQIEQICKVDNIDILYAPGVSDVERLMLLRPDNPLVYHKGVFQRVTDYVRHYPVIYPGAFNPPTKAHLNVALDRKILYEISQKHYYKGSVSIEGLIHRMRMLDLEDRPVLITQAPMMIDKYDAIIGQGKDSVDILMGADAWNMFTAAHQYPFDHWLTARMLRAHFIVRARNAVTIEQNSITATLSWTAPVELESTSYNSTDVRNAPIPADSPMLTAKVADYIRRHNLYKK